jgi:hypothetical protein
MHQYVPNRELDDKITKTAFNQRMRWCRVSLIFLKGQQCEHIHNVWGIDYGQNEHIMENTRPVPIKTN